MELIGAAHDVGARTVVAEWSCPGDEAADVRGDADYIAWINGVLADAGYARRWTFYIDPAGRIVWIDREVNALTAAGAESAAGATPIAAGAAAGVSDGTCVFGIFARLSRACGIWSVTAGTT